MKLKNTLLASALLSATALSAHAATELTPEQAAALKPYHTVITGRYNAIGDAVAAASKPTKTARPPFMLSTRLITATAATGASPSRCIKTMRQSGRAEKSRD
jgi:hypothetical protein